jgi:peptide chain release factor subunit 1
MIKYIDVEKLLDFHTQSQPIISFYLNTDPSQHSPDQQRIAARNLIREAHQSAMAGSWELSVKEALTQDLNRLEKLLKEQLETGYPHQGLAAFFCHEADLWQIFDLPRPVPSSITLEFTPHIRPLTLILDEYHRFGVLLLDRRSAELYEVYIGEIVKLENAFVAPANGHLSLAVEHPGSGDRGISTHRDEAEMQKHFRRVADALFHLSHRRHWEYLVLGGQQAVLVQFENFLHPKLRERLVGRFAAEPGKIRQTRILEELTNIERRVEDETERRLVWQLVDAANSKGLAVLGLNKVLKALRQGAVHMLYVEDGWRTSGVLCRECGYIDLKGELCPVCNRKTDPVGDVVDDAIEIALRTGSMIEHVNPTAGLADQGHIGAVLRFRV